MWCTTRISRTWFIISGLKDLASLFATDFLDICPLRSKNLTVVMCLREDNNFRLLACCLRFFYGIQSFRPVGSQILDLPQQLSPEYRFIALVRVLNLPAIAQIFGAELLQTFQLGSSPPQVAEFSDSSSAPSLRLIAHRNFENMPHRAQFAVQVFLCGSAVLWMKLCGLQEPRHYVSSA